MASIYTAVLRKVVPQFKHNKPYATKSKGIMSNGGLRCFD